ncbi:MAG TPA: isoleucine--tRNA ligase, partial [Solirubrobacteraceae bacterium]|nr:isoleucine--tRNA ligase [Solirubrobacteraceae bacterium]
MTAPTRHPLIPPRKVDPHQQLPALEVQVLARWREREVFAQSLRLREGAEPWIFYEGPPTANGRPGAHHVLSRVFKDIYPRYKTMRGHRVERKGGWDCHGLPVEIAVEQKLGINSKHEIENVVGIEEFNRQCRESVFEYLEEWNRLTERIGFWIDLEDAYRTLDDSYVESVWWALAQIHGKGLLYEGHKVVPYCPRCGTALSSHEVALGYKDVVDPSAYVRLPVRERMSTGPSGADTSGPLREGDALLIWTTTPWTLPGNVAVAVAPDVEYVRARREGETLILAGALVERVLGEGTEILDRFPGRELVGAGYAGPIFDLSDGGPPDAFRVIAGEFVTTEDGTGLVHIAPAFGEDDFDAAAAAGIFDPRERGTLYNPVGPDGTYDARVRDREGNSYEGRFVKDPKLTEELIADLEARGLLFRRSEYEHSYPHCWRCGTPLIYYAKASWYIRTTAIRERLIAENETVSWHPPHVKHGRFGDWLANNVDWALSRERYWGTPLPVWRCGAGHVHVVGSFGELRELSGVELKDPHRPYVDEIEFPCPHPTGEGSDGEGSRCAEPMRRVPEVIDVWFDSGAMPFAQHHHPFERPEDRGHFAERFPADFICEAQDQTRGWFYSLLAVSTLLFDRAPYRNVVCLGLILDPEGQKMSKSRGNTVEPWEVIERYGADAFRWYFFTAKAPWDGYRFSTETIGEGVRLFLRQLWSTHFFYSLYAEANAGELAQSGGGEASRAVDADGDGAGDGTGGAGDGGESGTGEDLDAWALSRTAGTAELVAERLDAYDATVAGRAIADLVDDLSNWYVRRSRRRFWDGEPAAFETLRECLLTIAKLLAPFCPFVADEIYENLDGELASVHLCDFPTAPDLPTREIELEEAMGIARETVRLGLNARAQAKIKVRQPLAEMKVQPGSDSDRRAVERFADQIMEELNVKKVTLHDPANGPLLSQEVKANMKTLGPKFGARLKDVQAAIAGAPAATLA